MEKEMLSARIGQRLRHFRQQRQLSLDSLADLTGVSKPMLGQIERGVSNPTVATLWKIASGLKIPFTALIAENPTVELLRANEQTRVVEDDERFEVYSTYSAPGIPLEMYRVRLHPGCRRDAEPHGFGVLESITVFRGNLTMEIGGDTYLLQSGDALSFSADMPHVYQNTGDTVCEISMAVIYQAGAQKSV
jgi:XRE family transcriptional regulator, regulator of sulfur utilization